MNPTNRLRTLVERTTSEHLLILSMMGIAAYMFVKADSFSPAASFFPKFTAIITLVGTTLLLFRNYLPTRLQQYVTASVSIIDQDVRVESVKSSVKETQDEESESLAETDDGPQMRWGSNPGLATVLLMAAYIVTSYLVGMLWVTPLFVFAYLVVFQARLVYAAVLSLLTFALAYAFMEILIIDINEGILLHAGVAL